MAFPSTLEVALSFYPTMCRKYGAEVVADFIASVDTQASSAGEQAEQMCERFPISDAEYRAEQEQEHMDDVVFALLCPDPPAFTAAVSRGIAAAFAELGISP